MTSAEVACTEQRCGWCQRQKENRSRRSWESYSAEWQLSESIPGFPGEMESEILLNKDGWKGSVVAFVRRKKTTSLAAERAEVLPSELYPDAQNSPSQKEEILFAELFPIQGRMVPDSASGETFSLMLMNKN